MSPVNAATLSIANTANNTAASAASPSAIATRPDRHFVNLPRRARRVRSQISQAIGNTNIETIMPSETRNGDVITAAHCRQRSSRAAVLERLVARTQRRHQQHQPQRPAPPMANSDVITTARNRNRVQSHLRHTPGMAQPATLQPQRSNRVGESSSIKSSSSPRSHSLHVQRSTPGCAVSPSSSAVGSSNANTCGAPTALVQIKRRIAEKLGAVLMSACSRSHRYRAGVYPPVRDQALQRICINSRGQALRQIHSLRRVSVLRNAPRPLAPFRKIEPPLASPPLRSTAAMSAARRSAQPTASTPDQTTATHLATRLRPYLPRPSTQATPFDPQLGQPCTEDALGDAGCKAGRSERRPDNPAQSPHFYAKILSLQRRTQNQSDRSSSRLLCPRRSSRGGVGANPSSNGDAIERALCRRG